MNDKNKNRRRMLHRDILPKEDKEYMEVSIHKKRVLIATTNSQDRTIFKSK